MNIYINGDNNLTSSILFKELERTNDLSSCCEFWSLDNSKDLFKQISKKIDNLSIISLLEGLSYKEAEFFYLLLQNNGTTTSMELFQKKFSWENDINTISNSLQKKYLIFIRKSISKIKIVPYSYSIYPEILRAIKLVNIVTIPELAKSFSISNINNSTNPSNALSENWNKLFTANLGQFRINSLPDLGLDNELSKYLSEKVCNKGLLFNKKFYYVVIMNRTSLDHLNNLGVKKTINNYKKLFFLSSLYHSYFQIRTNGIYVTNKNQIRKYDSNFLNKLFLRDSELQNSLLTFLEDAGFIYISEGQYLTDPSFIEFLKKSINEKLMYIVSVYPKVKRAFDLIARLSKNSFNHWDIAQQYFIDKVNLGYFSYNILKDQNLNHENIISSLDFLFQIGLLKRNQNDYSLSFLGERLINNDQDIDKSKVPECGGIVVNSDYSLLVYPDRLSEYHSFLVELFACRKNDGVVWEYSIKKDTIQRGVYLGFSHEEFINCLKDNSVRGVPDSIIYNINSWTQKLKKVFVKQITVLTGDQNVLELLQYDKDISQQVQKIGKDYLLYDSKNGDLPHYIQSDEGIFLIREGDNLCHEKR